MIKLALTDIIHRTIEDVLIRLLKLTGSIWRRLWSPGLGMRMERNCEDTVTGIDVCVRRMWVDGAGVSWRYTYDAVCNRLG